MTDSSAHSHHHVEELAEPSSGPGHVPGFGVLVPVRSFLFQIYLVTSIVIFGTLGLPVLLFGKDVTRKFCRFWCHTVLFGLRWICGINHIMTGQDYLPDGAAIIAANHQSMWETMVLFLSLDKPVVVVKQELLDVPIFGFWLKHGGAVPIDREAGPRAMRKILRITKQTLADKGQMVIFPEGTRAAPGEVLPLQAGIAGMYTMGGVPVIPVAHNSGRYWLYPGWIKIPGTVEMVVAPPIQPGMERDEFLTHITQKLLEARPDVSIP